MVDVSDILRDRMHEPSGLERMVGVSVLVHGALFALLILAPAFSPRQADPKTVMTISLGGGAPGPVDSGLTQQGGRPIQAEQPEDPAKREAIRPPAAKAPEMTVPESKARRQAAAAKVEDAPRDARGKTATKGKEVTPGTTVADTGIRGQGFGLASGGGQGGTAVRLDVGNFCCPDYIITMTQLIQRNWSPRAENVGNVVMKFTVMRDGMINRVELETSSGFTALDLGAQRALLTTRQLPPLPAAYPNPDLVIHLTFNYAR